MVGAVGPGALGRHLALVGYMGAGKTTVGREVARLTERPFLDTDAEIERRHGPIPALFEERGEPEFRRLEEAVVAEALGADEPAVVALGGGAVLAEATRERLRRRAFTILLEVDVGTAWSRVRTGERPLARDEGAFRRLFDERRERYRESADAVAFDDPDEVLLQALRVHAAEGIFPRFRELGGETDDGTALIADERVLALHPPPFDGPIHRVPAGEDAKRLEIAERLWNELEVGRLGVVYAFGGGTTTDLAGFVAALHRRGVPWVAVPTTLVGQVDAAIGGKTGVDLPSGKNLVGAFHFPEAVVADPDLLATLPERERRQGMAEVVKTGLLAGRPLWDLSDEAMVRGCAAFKCGVVLSDPYERGRRAILNFGHTFGHALEAASGYSLAHGDAVALGLVAALRLSGQPTDVVEEILCPQPVRVDREGAWAALGRDKKGRAGRPRIVLLRGPGEPEWGVELPERDVRAALDDLIVD